MRGSQCRSRDVNFYESVALRQRVYYKIIWNLTTELVMWKNPDEGLTFEKSALEFLYDVHWMQSLTRLTSALEFLYDVHWIQSLTRLIQRNVIVSRLISAGARRSELFTRKQGNNHKPHRIPLLKLKTQKIKGFCIKFLERNEIGTKTAWTVSFAANESDDLQGYANTCAIFCLLQTQTRLQGVNH